MSFWPVLLLIHDPSTNITIHSKPDLYKVWIRLRGVEIITNPYQSGAGPYLQVVSPETIELQDQRKEVDILRRAWTPAFSRSKHCAPVGTLPSCPRSLLRLLIGTL